MQVKTCIHCSSHRKNWEIAWRRLVCENRKTGGTVLSGRLYSAPGNHGSSHFLMRKNVSARSGLALILRALLDPNPESRICTKAKTMIFNFRPSWFSKLFICKGFEKRSLMPILVQVKFADQSWNLEIPHAHGFLCFRKLSSAATSSFSLRRHDGVSDPLIT